MKTHATWLTGVLAAAVLLLVNAAVSTTSFSFNLHVPTTATASSGPFAMSTGLTFGSISALSCLCPMGEPPGSDMLSSRDGWVNCTELPDGASAAANAFACKVQVSASHASALCTEPRCPLGGPALSMEKSRHVL
jgi:hypothetical protein